MASLFELFEKIRQRGSEPSHRGVDYLIVGLGNPGLKYENTRHNAGFMALDVLAKQNRIPVNRSRFHALTGMGIIGGKNCLLLKPQTFMNNSGQAVQEAMQFYKLDVEQLIVLCDDISLEPGRMRIRRKGSDGGHNGLKDLIACTGDQGFVRVKIGVGKKPRPDYDLAAWVLSNFTQQELELLDPVLEHTAKAVKLILQGETDEAMNRFNH